jgi:hypothetical protein
VAAEEVELATDLRYYWAMRNALTAIPLSISLLFSAALAQAPPSEAVKAMLGSWEISNADHDKICIVTLRPQATPGGMKLEFDKACAEAFPLTKGVTAWTIGSDALRLVDPKGKPALELNEVENGMFQGERPGEGLFFMQKPGAANPEAAPEKFPEN